MYFGITTGSIWELKPVSYKKPYKFEMAKIQLNGYVTQANFQNEGNLMWYPGTSSGNPVPFEGTLKLEDDSHNYSYWVGDAKAGIIFYIAEPKKIQPNPVLQPIKETEPSWSPQIPKLKVPDAKTVGILGALTAIGAALLTAGETAVNILFPVVIVNPEMYQQNGIPQEGQVY